MKRYLSILAISFLLFSCEENTEDVTSNEDISEDTETQTSQNSGEEGSEEETTENSNILPIKVVTTGNGYTDTINYQYSGNKLIKVVYSSEEYIDYLYTNDQLTNINYYGVFDSLETLTYDSQGRVSSYENDLTDEDFNHIENYYRTFNDDNSLISEKVGEDVEFSSFMHFDNGNVTKIESDGDYKHEFTSFDNKNAPFKNVFAREVLVTIDSENNFAYQFNLNNILSETYTDFFFETPTSETITYSITYTDDDFPRTIVSSEGYTYTYTYNND